MGNIPIITLIIEGEKIPEIKFKHAINSFFCMVDEVAKRVIGETKDLKWLVSVEGGSINLGLSPDTEQGIIKDVAQIHKIYEIVGNGIASVRIAEKRPEYYTDSALEALEDLVSTIDPEQRYIKNIKIRENGKSHSLNLQVAKNIGIILGIRKEEYGSVEGKLAVISSRRGFHFVVYDFIFNRPVICYFEEGLTSNILDAFDKRIYVFGLIKYRKGGIPYSIQVDKFRILESPENLPKFKDVLGILKGSS